MAQIRCPYCGHILGNRIEFGSHLKRCKENNKFKFDSPKNNSKRRPWQRNNPR
jgi:phage FluMu protein Com